MIEILRIQSTVRLNKMCHEKLELSIACKLWIGACIGSACNLCTLARWTNASSLPVALWAGWHHEMV